MMTILSKSSSFKLLAPSESQSCSGTCSSRSSSANSTNTVTHVPGMSSCEGNESTGSCTEDHECVGELQSVSVLTEASASMLTETQSIGCLTPLKVLSFYERDVCEPAMKEALTSDAHWTPGRLLEAAAASAPPGAGVKTPQGQGDLLSLELSLLEVVHAQDELISEIMAKYEALEVEAFAIREQLVEMQGSRDAKQVPNHSNASWVEGRKSYAAQLAALRVKLHRALASDVGGSGKCKECARLRARSEAELACKPSRGSNRGDSNSKILRVSKQACAQTIAKSNQKVRSSSQTSSSRRQTMPCMSHRPAMALNVSGRDSKSAGHVRTRSRTSRSRMAANKNQCPCPPQERVSGDCDPNVAEPLSACKAVAVRDTVDAPACQDQLDVCTVAPDVSQIRQEWNLQSSLDGRRIRSWSPPTEGRGISYVETVGGSKWIPHAATRERARAIAQSAWQECARTVSQPARHYQERVSGDCDLNVAEPLSACNAVAVRDTVDAPACQDQLDVCTVAPDVSQTRQEWNFQSALDGRRIRSWSPPVEGRGISYVETVGGSKWIPHAATKESARVIAQPAWQERARTVSQPARHYQEAVPNGHFIQEKLATTTLGSVKQQQTAVMASSMPHTNLAVVKAVTPRPEALSPAHPHAGQAGGPALPHAGSVLGQQSQSVPANGIPRSAGMAAVTCSASPCAGMAAIKNGSTAMLTCALSGTGLPPCEPSANQALAPLPVLACAKFKFSSGEQNAFEGVMSERSMSPIKSPNAFGRPCGGSMHVVVPCQAVTRHVSGSLQVPVPCEVVGRR